MPNRDAILLETVKTHRARLASAFVHGELTQRRLANDNVRRLVAGVVAAAVLCAGCVGYSFVMSVLGRQARDAQTQAGLGPATGPVAVADTFDRRSDRGWGRAERGGRWTTSPPRDFSVAGGAARVVLPDAGLRTALLADTLQDRSDVTVTLRRDQGFRDGTLTVGVLGRRVSSTQDYRADLALRGDGSVALSLVRRAEPGNASDQPTQVLSPTVILVGRDTSDDPAPADLVVRVQAVGTGPTTLRAKAWLVGGGEPQDWTVTASDDTVDLQRPGSVGLQAVHRGEQPASLLVTDLVGRQAP